MPRQNLKQATRKSALESKLSQLDSLGTAKSDFIIEDGLTAIEQMAGDFVKKIQDNIEKEGMNVTGGASDISIERTDNGVQILANPWLIYQDAGVSGTVTRYNTPFAYTTKMPPVSAFKEWIERKKIQTRNNKAYSGKEQSFKEVDSNGAAWAMAKNKMKHGQKPRNIYSKEIPGFIEQLKEAVGDVVVQTIQKTITK